MRNRDRVGVGFERQLTLRSMLIGALGAVVITTSSMYVALRMGALPWPTIFVAVLSMALLKLLGNTNLKEINVTHTAMSAGGEWWPEGRVYDPGHLDALHPKHRLNFCRS